VRLSGITYDSARRFSWWQRVQLLLLPPVLAGIMRLLLSTCRTEVRGGAWAERGLGREGHTLIAFWHESMHLACWIYRGHDVHTLTSHSFDGELAARVIRHFGLEAIRGSSSMGGADGLRQMQTAAMQLPQLGFTLDGPRGPRRLAKAGIGVLAARTQLPVIPLAIIPVRCFRLGSWDRLPVPYPFTKIIYAFGESVPAPASDSGEEVEKTRLAVERGLNGVHETVEREVGITNYELRITY